MARLFWLLLMLAFVAALATGVSWIAAYTSVGKLLGAPPPRMGTQHTSIQWHEPSEWRKRPPVWRFVFSPTAIPGATTVRIYVNPWGHVVSTDPADLDVRLKDFHNTGY
jgi:hypothetical protein